MVLTLSDDMFWHPTVFTRVFVPTVAEIVVIRNVTCGPIVTGVRPTRVDIQLKLVTI